MGVGSIRRRRRLPGRAEEGRGEKEVENGLPDSGSGRRGSQGGKWG